MHPELRWRSSQWFSLFVGEIPPKLDFPIWWLALCNRGPSSHYCPSRLQTSNSSLILRSLFWAKCAKGAGRWRSEGWEYRVKVTEKYQPRFDMRCNFLGASCSSLTFVWTCTCVTSVFGFSLWLAGMVWDAVRKEPDDEGKRWVKENELLGKRNCWPSQKWKVWITS